MFSKKSKGMDEDYVKGEIAEVKEEDVDVVMENQEEIADKIQSSNALKKYTELGKVLFGMIKDYKNNVYRDVPWFTIAAVVFAFLYILNPFDIIPDFIPGIGYVDDFAIFTVCLRFIETDIHNYLDWKLADQEEEEEVRGTPEQA